MAGNMDRLNAAAAGGTAGVQAYDKAISDVGSQQQQALTDAATRAGALNAPQAFLDKQNAFLSTPGNAAIGQLQADRGALGNYQGALNSANGQYLSGIGASKALLSQLGIKEQGGIQAKALQAAASALSSQINLQKLLNPDSAQTPAQQRAATQFGWAQQSHIQQQQDAVKAEQAKTARAAIENELINAPGTKNKLALGALQYNDLPTAIAALQSDKAYSKLKAPDQQAIVATLRAYYDPWNEVQQNSVATPQFGG
jgi:hypothetical protein